MNTSNALFGKFQREWLQIWKQDTFELESVQDLNFWLGIQTKKNTDHCIEVSFTSFLSSGFNTMAVINPPERKLAKRTSVH